MATTIIIDVEANLKDVQKQIKLIEKEFKRLEKIKVSTDATKNLQNSFQKVKSGVQNLNKQFTTAAKTTQKIFKPVITDLIDLQNKLIKAKVSNEQFTSAMNQAMRQINSETMKLNKALTEGKISLKDYAVAMKQIKSEKSIFESFNLQKIQPQLKGTKHDIDSLTASLRAAKVTSSQFEEIMRRAGRNIDTSMNKVSRDFQQGKISLDQYLKSMQQLNSEKAKFNKLGIPTQAKPLKVDTGLQQPLKLFGMVGNVMGGGGLTSAVGMAGPYGAAAAAAIGAFQKGTETAIAFYKAFDEARRISDSFAVSMERNPAFSGMGLDKIRELTAEFTKYANAQQLVTNFSAGEIQVEAQRFANMGLNIEQMKTLSTVTQDLATKYNMSLSMATDKVTQAYQGNMKGLNALGINFDESKVKAEGFSYVMNTIASNVEGSAEQMANPFKVLQNNINSLKDLGGKAIAPLFDPIMKSLQQIMPHLHELVDIIATQIAGSLDDIDIEAITQSVIDLIKAFSNLSKKVDTGKSLIEAFKGYIELTFLPLKALIAPVVDLVDMLMNAINTIKGVFNGTISVGEAFKRLGGIILDAVDMPLRQVYNTLAAIMKASTLGVMNISKWESTSEMALRRDEGIKKAGWSIKDSIAAGREQAKEKRAGMDFGFGGKSEEKIAEEKEKQEQAAEKAAEKRRQAEEKAAREKEKVEEESRQRMEEAEKKVAEERQKREEDLRDFKEETDRILADAAKEAREKELDEIKKANEEIIEEEKRVREFSTSILLREAERMNDGMGKVQTDLMENFEWFTNQFNAAKTVDEQQKAAFEFYAMQNKILKDGFQGVIDSVNDMNKDLSDSFKVFDPTSQWLRGMLEKIQVEMDKANAEMQAALSSILSGVVESGEKFVLKSSELLNQLRESSINAQAEAVNAADENSKKIEELLNKLIGLSGGARGLALQDILTSAYKAASTEIEPGGNAAERIEKTIRLFVDKVLPFIESGKFTSLEITSFLQSQYANFNNMTDVLEKLDKAEQIRIDKEKEASKIIPTTQQRRSSMPGEPDMQPQGTTQEIKNLQSRIEDLENQLERNPRNEIIAEQLNEASRELRIAQLELLKRESGGVLYQEEKDELKRLIEERSTNINIAQGEANEQALKAIQKLTGEMFAAQAEATTARKKAEAEKAKFDRINLIYGEGMAQLTDTAQAYWKRILDNGENFIKNYTKQIAVGSETLTVNVYDLYQRALNNTLTEQDKAILKAMGATEDVLKSAADTAAFLTANMSKAIIDNLFGKDAEEKFKQYLKESGFVEGSEEWNEAMKGFKTTPDILNPLNSMFLKLTDETQNFILNLEEIAEYQELMLNARKKYLDRLYKDVIPAEIDQLQLNILSLTNAMQGLNSIILQQKGRITEFTQIQEDRLKTLKETYDSLIAAEETATGKQKLYEQYLTDVNVLYQNEAIFYQLLHEERMKYLKENGLYSNNLNEVNNRIKTLLNDRKILEKNYIKQMEELQKEEEKLRNRETNLIDTFYTETKKLLDKFLAGEITEAEYEAQRQALIDIFESERAIITTQTQETLEQQNQIQQDYQEEANKLEKDLQQQQLNQLAGYMTLLLDLEKSFFTMLYSIYDEIANLESTIGEKFGNITQKLGETISQVGDSFFKISDSFKEKFKALSEKLKASSEKLKAVGAAFSAVGAIISEVSKIVGGISQKDYKQQIDFMNSQINAINKLNETITKQMSAANIINRNLLDTAKEQLEFLKSSTGSMQNISISYKGQDLNLYDTMIKNPDKFLSTYNDIITDLNQGQITLAKTQAEYTTMKTTSPFGIASWFEKDMRDTMKNLTKMNQLNQLNAETMEKFLDMYEQYNKLIKQNAEEQLTISDIRNQMEIKRAKLRNLNEKLINKLELKGIKQQIRGLTQMLNLRNLSGDLLLTEKERLDIQNKILDLRLQEQDLLKENGFIMDENLRRLIQERQILLRQSMVSGVMNNPALAVNATRLIQAGLPIEEIFPSFQTGITYIPNTMPAIIHQGESVMTKQITDSLIRLSGMLSEQRTVQSNRPMIFNIKEANVNEDGIIRAVNKETRRVTGKISFTEL